MKVSTPAPPPIGTQRQPELSVSSGSKKAKPRRKWSLVALFVLLALAGALVAMSAVNRAGGRESVLALGRDVQAGQQISDGDLQVVSVSSDPVLSPVLSKERSQVVGQTAAVDLRRGTLLTRSQLQVGHGLGDDQQVVGVEVKRGLAPRDELRPGDKVLAVILPVQGADGAAPAGKGTSGGSLGSIEATVKSVGRADATGSLVVNLVVSPTQGPELAAKAAAKQIALVRQPRGGN